MVWNSPYTSAMLDEDEKRRQMMQAAYAQQPPGQVTPSQSLDQFQYDPAAIENAQAALDPLEGKLNRQRALAAELRGTAMPEGRTVGPSGTYVVNPYDQAAAGIKRLVGGYMDRRANKFEEGDVKEARKGLTAARTEKAEKEQGLARYLAQRQMDRDAAADKREDTKLGLREREVAMDEAEVQTQFAMGPDGETIPYVMTYDQEMKRVVPTDPTTGETVDLRGAQALKDTPQGSTNAPERYIDIETGDEYFLSWDKGKGQYKNAFTGKYMTEAEFADRPLTREKEMTEAQMQKAWQTYTDKNADTLALMHDMEAAEEAFYELGWDGKGSVFNWFTKQGNVIGDVARVAADQFQEGAPTQNAYAAAQTVYNAISRLRAGLSQTVAEISRIKKETGEDPLVSSEVMMKYWDRLGGKLENDIRIQQASITPRMRQAYARYGGGAPEAPQDPRAVEEAVAPRNTRSGRGIGGNQGAPAGLPPKPPGMSDADYERLKELHRKRNQ